MRHIAFGLLLAGVLAATPTFAETPAPTPPPAEAFGQAPTIGNVALAPSGALLAWSDSSAPVTKVIVFDVATRTLKRSFDLGNNKLRSLYWSDDETLLMNLSVTFSVRAKKRYTNEWFRTLAANVTDGSTQVLLMNQAEFRYVTGATLVAPRTPRPHTILMSTWDYSPTQAKAEIDSRLNGGRKDDGWVLSLFEVDTRTGNGKRIDEGSPYTTEWLADRDGRSLARGEYDPARGVFRVLLRDGLAWREIHRQEDADTLSLHSLSPDGKALLASGANGQALRKLWSIPLDGSGAKPLIESADRDIDGAVFDPYSWDAVGAAFGGTVPEIRWLDPKAETRFKALTKAFPGRQIRIAGRSQDYMQVLARVSGPSFPAMFYLVNFSKGTADIAGEDYPALANAVFGEVRPMTYKARDGVEIPAYLTLPPGKDAKHLPLVVLPHGGPESRDDYDFDWLAQFLATRGYAVLQPQFRGSSGFGEAHRLAGYRQWGARMQDDVNDGVKTLIEQGLADPNRVCIAGASYGGYAALAGVAFAPELYACAISINGVADLPAMLGHVLKYGGDESNAIAYWRDHIGESSDPHVIGASPARAAQKIRAPVLLIHGADDTVVPITQSEGMDRALGALGKPRKFVRLKGEDHWLSGNSSRTEVLKEMETFLATHLGAR